MAENSIVRRLLSRSALVFLAFALWLGLIVVFLTFCMRASETAALFLLRFHVRAIVVIVTTQAFFTPMMFIVASRSAKKNRRQKAARPPRRTYPLGLG